MCLHFISLHFILKVIGGSELLKNEKNLLNNPFKAMSFETDLIPWVLTTADERQNGCYDRSVAIDLMKKHESREFQLNRRRKDEETKDEEAKDEEEKDENEKELENLMSAYQLYTANKCYVA